VAKAAWQCLRKAIGKASPGLNLRCILLPYISSWSVVPAVRDLKEKLFFATTNFSLLCQRHKLLLENVYISLEMKGYHLPTNSTVLSSAPQCTSQRRRVQPLRLFRTAGRDGQYESQSKIFGTNFYCKSVASALPSINGDIAGAGYFCRRQVGTSVRHNSMRSVRCMVRSSCSCK
jgi:hypothetical protein